MQVKKEINVEVGARIKLARENLGLTQEELAERLDVLPQYVSAMECGRAGLSLFSLKRVCTALGVSSDNLLFGQTPESRAIRLTEKCRAMPDQKFEQLIRIAEVLMDSPEA